jgi:hypothetical protein
MLEIRFRAALDFIRFAVRAAPAEVRFRSGRNKIKGPNGIGFRKPLDKPQNRFLTTLERKDEFLSLF